MIGKFNSSSLNRNNNGNRWDSYYKNNRNYRRNNLSRLFSLTPPWINIDEKSAYKIKQQIEKTYYYNTYIFRSFKIPLFALSINEVSKESK